MLISVNSDPNRAEFEVLLDNTLDSLRNTASKQSKKYLDLLGNKLENEVFDILTNCAKNTIFDGSIELISGQKFPDIIAKKYYGIEVKTTTKANSWKSTGSSVAEGTRVEGIERIFMLFGKMSTPVEFMCKPYEDCLSEVVVTHSPRYLIDMNLKKGQTIFDKLNVPYDVLRKQPNPIKTILNYYKKQLKAGDDVWYLDQSTVQSTNIIIKMWNNLKVEERAEYMIQGFCLFPELVSNRPDKFNRFALWLSTRQGVICPNVRDVFTAGGQGVINFNDNSYSTVPQIIMRIYQNLNKIKLALSVIDIEEIKAYWNCELQEADKFSKWVELIEINSKSTLKNNLPLSKILLKP